MDKAKTLFGIFVTNNQQMVAALGSILVQQISQGVQMKKENS